MVLSLLMDVPLTSHTRSLCSVTRPGRYLYLCTCACVYPSVVLLCLDNPNKDRLCRYFPRGCQPLTLRKQPKQNAIVQHNLSLFTTSRRIRVMIFRVLVCEDFIYTLEIIARILREVVNRDRLCGTIAFYFGCFRKVGGCQAP